MLINKRKQMFFSLILIAVYTILTVALLLCFLAIKKDTQSVSDDEIKYERHQPTLEDNFLDDCVIVILKSKYSDVNKKHEFLEISKDIKISDIKDLTYIIDPSAIEDRDSFSQIFSLTLKNRGKENVLSAIKELEKLDYVLAAESKYIFETTDNWKYIPYEDDFGSGYQAHCPTCGRYRQVYY